MLRGPSTVMDVVSQFYNSSVPFFGYSFKITTLYVVLLQLDFVHWLGPRY